MLPTKFIEKKDFYGNRFLWHFYSTDFVKTLSFIFASTLDNFVLTLKMFA